MGTLRIKIQSLFPYAVYLTLMAVCFIGLRSSPDAVFLHRIHYIAFCVFSVVAIVVLVWSLRAFRIDFHSFRACRAKSATSLVVGVFVGYSVLAASFWVYFSTPPLVVSFVSADSDVAFVGRLTVGSGLPVWVHYLGGLLFQGVLPLALVLLIRSKKLFWFAYSLSLFVALLFMEKKLTVFPYVAPVVVCLWQRYWSRALWTMFFSGVSFIFLVIVANPVGSMMRNQPEYSGSGYWGLVSRYATGIKNRVLIAPGDMAAAWAERIPEKFPFANGCGYGLISKVMGCSFVDYPKLVAGDLFPELKAEGKIGSSNAPAYMTDYANFGTVGVILGAAVIAVVLSVIAYIFWSVPVVGIALTGPQIFLLGSSAWTTMLASGGLSLLLVMYWIYGHLVPRVLANGDAAI